MKRGATGMSEAPSARQLEMLARVAREEDHDRRTIMRVQVASAIVLMASTLLAWMNHPRVEHQGGLTPGYVVREIGNSVGLATKPAGLLVLGIGVLALAGARPLKSGRLRPGWWTFVLALGSLSVCATEIIQLMLGRRNWLGNLSRPVAGSSLSNAIGLGVWLAALASVALFANSATYLWLSSRLWRRAKKKSGQ
jgi:hypothetical protein